MTIDGFLPEHAAAFASWSPVHADKIFGATSLLGQRLGVGFSGMDHLPSGGALVVTNHTFGWDSIFPIAEVWRVLGRPLWSLGEHAWWHVPFVRKEVARLGVVDGSRRNVDALLSAGQLVLVLPGGLRESVKPRELKYRLLWGERYGFVRAALRNQVPIVPMASIGGDDVFDLVGDAFGRGQRWLRSRRIPVPLPARILPIPRAVRFRFLFGEPIPPRGRAEDTADPQLLSQVRHEVGGALHELIEQELARRAGIDLSPRDAARSRGTNRRGASW